MSGVIGVIGFQEGLGLDLGLLGGEGGLALLVPGAPGIEALHRAGPGVHGEGAPPDAVLGGAAVLEGAGHPVLGVFVALEQGVGGADQLIVCEAIFRYRTEPGVQGLLGLHALQLLDAGLFGGGEGTFLRRGGGGGFRGVVGGASAGGPALEHPVLQLGEVDELTGGGVHVEVVSVLGQVPEDGPGGIVVGEDVFQPQVQGGPQESGGLRLRGGGHGGRDAAQTRVGQHVPAEADHLQILRPDGEGEGQRGRQAV